MVQSAFISLFNVIFHFVFLSNRWNGIVLKVIFMDYNPNFARVLGVGGAGVPGSFLPGVTIAVLQIEQIVMYFRITIAFE